MFITIERMTKVDENMAQAKKMLETIVERDYELQKEVGEWRSKCYILEEENKKLKAELEVWKNANKKLRMHDAKMEYENKKLREELSAYDREYFDEDKKANTIFMEEDTLQELRDLGKI